MLTSQPPGDSDMCRGFRKTTHWTGQLRQDWWAKASVHSPPMIKLKLSENWEKRPLPRIIPNIFLSNVQILQNYEDNSRIRRLLKNLDFYVLPVFNIDGYIYTWTTVSTLSLVLGWVHELDIDSGSFSDFSHCNYKNVLWSFKGGNLIWN